MLRTFIGGDCWMDALEWAGESMGAASVLDDAKAGKLTIRQEGGFLAVPVREDKGWRYVSVRTKDEPIDGR